jgi:hypothetical protein
MFKTSDGKSYGHAGRARAHEASVGKSSGGSKHKMAGGNDEPGAKESEGEGEEPSMHEVVAEHGLANKTEIEGDGDNFKVTSHHEDGHVHKSKGHESAHAAHMHSMHAMTGEQPEEMASEGEGAGAGMGGGGGMGKPAPMSIPGM